MEVLEGVHKLQWASYVMIITLITSCLQPVIRATEKPGGTNGTGTHFYTNDTLYRYSEESFLILYEGDIAGHHTLNCTAPSAASFLQEDLEVSLYWTPPSGVKLLKEQPDVTPQGTSQGKAKGGLMNHGIGAWVELAQNRQLIFHNPDDSIRGPYTCQGRVDGRLIYRSTVWVHVFTKTSSFGGSTNIITALCVVVAFLMAVLLLLGVRALWLLKRRRFQYIGAKTRDGHLEIPEIRIHTVEDQSNSYTDELDSL